MKTAYKISFPQLENPNRELCMLPDLTMIPLDEFLEKVKTYSRKHVSAFQR